ncbi:MAG: rhomboid family intramembrane serine protease [Phycisphaerales bacterium]
MGIQDRDYYRDGRSPNDGFFAPAGFRSMSGWSFNTWIIVVNVVVFLADIFLRTSVSYPSPVSAAFQMGPLEYWGYFSTTTALQDYQIWRFISFQFLHANFFHILFNMLGLFWFGPEIERYLGSRRYLAFYLLCGVAGAALYLILNVAGIIWYQQTQQSLPILLIHNPAMPLVGASAGVFGVLLGVAYLRPRQLITVFIFFIPITMQVRTLAYGLVLIALYTVLFGGQNAGGQAGHLGGAALGALLIRRPRVLNWALLMPLDGLKSRGHHAFRNLAGGAGRGSSVDDAEIDRILSKVATQGLHSLTARERRVLESATEEKRGGR